MIKNTSCPVCKDDNLVVGHSVTCSSCGYKVNYYNQKHSEAIWDAWHEAVDKTEFSQDRILVDRIILSMALKTYGREHQLRMCQEECMELALAIQKMYRDETPEEESTENLYNELADVLITTRQVTMMLDKERLQKAVDAKMSRLKERINAKIINDLENGKVENNSSDQKLENQDS